jgi:hypothetical protein
MPLKNVFDTTISDTEQQRKLLYRRYGLFNNPFPSAAQTNGHPHMPTRADDQVDGYIKTFYNDRKSQAVAITASQGIGKTNFLNAYEQELRDFMGSKGFFVIRYVADPEPSFDPFIRSIFTSLQENNLLSQAIEASISQSDSVLSSVKMPEVRSVLISLQDAKKTSEEKFQKRLDLANDWLLGLPVRKEHRTELCIQFRLDTVESKTRALRDIVSFSTDLRKLEGIFLLLDELEKQTGLPKTKTLQYLTALRALIDALPKNLFLMVALTTDALERYKEMLPALRGRLTNQIPLKPLQTEREALELMQFYIEHSRKESSKFSISSEAQQDWGMPGTETIIAEEEARKIFNDFLHKSFRALEGVRQREFLNELHNQAENTFANLLKSRKIGS